MFAIVSGLGHGSVSRLRNTWDKLPSKYVKMFTVSSDGRIGASSDCRIGVTSDGHSGVCTFVKDTEAIVTLIVIG